MTTTDELPDDIVVAQRYEAAVPIERLSEHPDNSRVHDEDLIDESVETNGFYGAIYCQEGRDRILAGHGRVGSLLRRGATTVPVIWLDVDDDTADRILAVDNRSDDRSGYQTERLAAFLQRLQANNNLVGTGFNHGDVNTLLARVQAGAPTLPSSAVPGALPPAPDPIAPEPADPSAPTPVIEGPSLADRFLVPPFSVLDARQGYWRERKRQWLQLGIRSEVGRPRNLLKMSDQVLGGYDGTDTPNRSVPAPAPDVVVEREARIEEGDDTWVRVRADLRRACDIEGAKARDLDEWCETNGMAGHWLGDSQPLIPTPKHWRTLAEHLPLDPDLFDIMTKTVERPASEGTRLVGRRQPNHSTPGSDSGSDPQFYYKKQRAEQRLGRELTTEEFLAEHYEGADAYYDGTSVFDPVLCEVAYRWWCPPRGRVLDPFAGGSVRGVVASYLGLPYVGCELRPEQVAANDDQADTLCGDPRPRWIIGDSAETIPALPDDDPFDFVFSCPPYFDLEQYGDDPADLSGMTWDEFCAAYRRIIAAAVDRLADDRFACFVVGDVRDPKGNYRGFVPETIAAFEAAGARYYNDAILVTSVGSLALRAARIFSGGRKLGKSHQNVVVFVKGSPQRAAEALGELVLPDPADLFGAHIGADADPEEPSA